MEPEAVMQSETIQSNLHVSHMKRLTEYIGILVIQYQARKAQVLHFTACLPLLLFAWFTTLHARVAVKIIKGSLLQSANKALDLRCCDSNYMDTPNSFCRSLWHR